MPGMRKDRYITLTRSDMETLEKGLTLTKDLDVYGVDRVKLIKEEEFPKWDERRNDIYEKS